MPRSFLTSRIVTVPRESATMPSFSNDFKGAGNDLSGTAEVPRDLLVRGGEHRGTGADAFILEISGKALVKPRKEKLAPSPT